MKYFSKFFLAMGLSATVPVFVAVLSSQDALALFAATFLVLYGVAQGFGAMNAVQGYRFGRTFFQKPFLNMPRLLWFLYAVILVLGVMLAWPAFENPLVNERFRAIGLAIVILVLCLVVVWYLIFEPGARFLPEYEVRRILEAEGMSPQEIRSEIARLRMKGMIQLDPDDD